MSRNRALLGQLYFGLFILYLLVPLIVMAGAAFNDSKLPTMAPQEGLYTGNGSASSGPIQVMWETFVNSILVALAVVALAVPIGTAAAIVLNSISGKYRATLYGFMVAPVLAPGPGDQHLDRAVLESDRDDGRCPGTGPSGGACIWRPRGRSATSRPM